MFVNCINEPEHPSVHYACVYSIVYNTVANAEVKRFRGTGIDEKDFKYKIEYRRVEIIVKRS